MKKKLPVWVQEHVDVLDTYAINEELKTCDAVHLYDTGVFGQQGNDQSLGFVDSKIFDVWCFNFDKKEKRKLEYKDELWLQGEIPVDKIRIFADGSTFVRFSKTVKMGWGQSLIFEI